MRYQRTLVNISLAKRSKPTAIFNVCMYIRIYTPYSDRGQISLVVYWKWFYQCVWDSRPVYSFQQYSLYTRSSLENDRCRILIGHFKKESADEGNNEFKVSLFFQMTQPFHGRRILCTGTVHPIKSLNVVNCC